MSKVYLSLGSNLRDRKNLIETALKLLEESGVKVNAVSSFFETEPWGFQCKDVFLNIAAEIETKLLPEDLLDLVQYVENQLGRTKKTQDVYESRVIDIDIIFYDNIIFYTKRLQIPHRLSHLRKFVLFPIAELNKYYRHPIFDKTVFELLQYCDDKTLVSIYN